MTGRSDGPFHPTRRHLSVCSFQDPTSRIQSWSDFLLFPSPTPNNDSVYTLSSIVVQRCPKALVQQSTRGVADQSRTNVYRSDHNAQLDAMDNRFVASCCLLLTIASEEDWTAPAATLLSTIGPSLHASVPCSVSTLAVLTMATKAPFSLPQTSAFLLRRVRHHCLHRKHWRVHLLTSFTRSSQQSSNQHRTQRQNDFSARVCNVLSAYNIIAPDVFEPVGYVSAKCYGHVHGGQQYAVGLTGCGNRHVWTGTTSGHARVQCICSSHK